MKKVFILCAGLFAFATTYAQKEKEEVKFAPPKIVKDKHSAKPMKGVDFNIKSEKGNTVIYAKKDGKTERILMKDWDTNPLKYESKYGSIPPPPPPPPAMRMAPSPPPPPPPPQKVKGE